ncbi:MAG: DNA-processing protein DprA [Oscillospiraceae bacterium]|jgi:DNA processing protein|nr:DNA-processing protein DprA [Oscillospiraceae bacterium]
MSADAVYWIWLQQAFGISASVLSAEILAAFPGGAREVYEASPRLRRMSGVLNIRQAERLDSTPLTVANRILEECGRYNLHILSPDDPRYPPLLKEIPNYPLALYAKGDPMVLQDHVCIALVGTRKPSRKSIDIAARLSGDLCAAGVRMVSGGALGIDSAAHWGALHAGGKTAAVLGCGICHPYLAENRSLRDKIAADGVILSEYPPMTEPTPYNFPTRNRIISGISHGTVVIEAGDRSGSLITAHLAAEQNRSVYAVPGEPFGSAYNGSNKLIKEGAKPVFSSLDVLEEFTYLYPQWLDMRRTHRDLERPGVDPNTVGVKKEASRQAPKKPSERKKAAKTAAAEELLPADAPPDEPGSPPAPPPDLPPAEAACLAALAAEPLHVDQLSKAASLPLPELYAALTMLEISGFVKQLPGRVYART